MPEEHGQSEQQLDAVRSLKAGSASWMHSGIVQSAKFTGDDRISPVTLATIKHSTFIVKLLYGDWSFAIDSEIKLTCEPLSSRTRHGTGVWIAREMGAKMSRRKGRKAATAAEEATPEIRVDETDVDRVAGGGRVDGGIDLAGGASEPDPPVSETKFIDSCFGHSIEPADPVPEAPVVIEILLNNPLENSAAVSIPEPSVDQNSTLIDLSFSGVCQGQIDEVVPILDSPVPETKFIDSCFDQSVEPADPVAESPTVIEISINNVSANATVVPIPEPPVDQNFLMTLSGVCQGKIDEITAVPIPDPPVTEQNSFDNPLVDSERPVDLVEESTVIDSVACSEPTAAASTLEPRAERYVRKFDLSISDSSEGVPEPRNLKTSQNSKKSARFSDLAQVKEFTVSESSIPTLYSVPVKGCPETVPELPPQNSNEVKYFWCYTCQNSRTNSLPWLLRLRYSKLSMYLRHLFCSSMFCAVICLVVLV
ncbi:uncharacterized protein LOC119769485 isoform X2 [Culex quinquefasciatus]|uniref:uncharacterized protein LOC119769485 isoform X2 n=1 Tax=Culex quinquefasciatus TaxID=7176 RepID=UPI0018E2FCFA|nr:uncharacterized protein LOC119769485 isoform X2 [Culex quinquefasciatus]